MTQPIWVLQKQEKLFNSFQSILTNLPGRTEESRMELERLLMEEELDPNIVINRITPLYVVMTHSAYWFNAAKSEENQVQSFKATVDILTILLRAGARVDQKLDLKGRVALHWVTKFAIAPLVTPLLNHGANVHLMDQDGNTPLHLLADSDLEKVGGNLNLQYISDMLVQAGASLSCKNQQGKTVMEMAKLRSVDFFLEKSFAQKEAKTLSDCVLSTMHVTSKKKGL